MLILMLVALSVLFLFHELYWKRRNLPPGPMPLPILGNLLDLKKSKPGYAPFVEWTKKYGSAFTFWIGPDPFLVITTYAKMKETFVRDGDTYVDKRAKYSEAPGILDSNGEMWREHRRFALAQLRDLGLGKDVMQTRILQEVEAIFEQCDSELKNDIDLPKIMDRAVGNVINSTLFGYRFGRDRADEFLELKRLIERLRSTMNEFKYYIQFMMPWSSKIIPGKTLQEVSQERRADLDNFFLRQVAEHKKNVNFDDDESYDYVEGYLKEQKKREQNGDTMTFSDKQLAAMCFDMWFAGLSTTTMTLTWGISYLLHNPDVKRKINEELDRVIGSDRLITTADKNDLPYMNAFINETQRCANIVPINLQHQTTRDTTVDGYLIKKGTGVIAQVATVMWDEQLFPEPEKFNPDRFIENGKLKKCEELLPFSIGKRQCLGEGLARMELYLFFANLLNRYDITPGSDGLPDLDKSISNMIHPRVFTAKMSIRHDH